MSCNACCGNCSGCAKALELTAAELQVLRQLSEIPFLPVARLASREEPGYPAGQKGLVLQCMEKKGLITLDYDRPLKGFADAEYLAFPLRGSMALTLRGQQVLELLDIQGISD